MKFSKIKFDHMEFANIITFASDEEINGHTILY